MLESVLHTLTLESDMQIRDLLDQSEAAVNGLEAALTPMRRKLAGMSPEEQEEFKEKEKLVELIQDQLQANRSNFNNEEYIPWRKVDRNNGLIIKKTGNEEEEELGYKLLNTIDKISIFNQPFGDMGARILGLGLLKNTKLLYLNLRIFLKQ